VLFLAHCTKEKGLFDAVHGVMKANEELRIVHSPFSLRLTVAGTFADTKEKAEFVRLQQQAPKGSIQYAGFLQGAEKTQALIDADLFCFPSHWENQPVSVIEALAFGLPLVISRLPSVEEMLPEGYAGVADLKNPSQIATALRDLILYEDFPLLRKHFATHFTLQHYLSNLAKVLTKTDSEQRAPAK
jgi:glycosyltransferase involved in cell wall biosynthesis